MGGARALGRRLLGVCVALVLAVSLSLGPAREGRAAGDTPDSSARRGRSNAAAGPALAAPGRASATTAFTVDGTGFAADADVQVYLDAANLATAHTDPSGAFAVGLQIPATAVPGIHWLSAVDASAASAQRSILVADPWLQPRGGSTLNGFNQYENLLDSFNVSTLAAARRGIASSDIEGAPVVDARGLSYVGTRGGEVVAFPSGCGGLACAPRWRLATGGQVVAAPTISRGVLYAASRDGTLYAVSTTCGPGVCAPLWAGLTGPGSDVVASPTVAGSRVFVASRDGRLYAFRARGCGSTTCDPLWSVQVGAGDPLVGSPAAGFDDVFVGSTDGRLYAYRAANGALRWQRDLGSAIDGSPVFLWEAKAEPVVYAVTHAGGVFDVRVANGGIKWSSSISGHADVDPALAYGLLYVPGDDGRLTAFRTWGCVDPCAPAWSLTIQRPAADEGVRLTPPVVANGLVYVSGPDGELHVVNARSGERVWRSGAGFAGLTSVAVANGTLFAGADDGFLRVFELDPRPAPPAKPDAAALEPFASPIRHVVVIFQENQSFDSVLGPLCVIDERCDGSKTGVLPTGQVVPLATGDDVVPEVGHNAAAQRLAVNDGDMNGFARIRGCGKKTGYACYQAYWPRQIPSLATLARRFVVADRTFESEAGPSWGAHFILATGNLDGFLNGNPAVNPALPGPNTWGCDSNNLILWKASPSADATLEPSCVPKQDGSGPFRPSPVPWVPTIMDRLDDAGLTWRIYQPNNIWSVCPTFADCLYHPRVNALAVPTQVITDARNGALPTVSFVIPVWPNSQHNGAAMAQGDNWITQVVNAIQRGPEWEHTAVFITYDDCGCFYDHVVPPAGAGIRVPMVIVSPWARAGFTDHNVATFESMLAFTEHSFGLPPLFTTDAAAYDFGDAFDYGQAPLAPVALRERRVPPGVRARVEYPKYGVPST